MRTTIYSIAFVTLCVFSHAQQYQLKNGRRFAMSDVKIVDKKFVTSVVSPTGLQSYNFTVDDISSVSFPPSPEFASAQKLFIEGKYEEALAQLDIVFDSQKIYIMLPGSFWSKALLLQLDIYEKTGKDPVDSKYMKELEGMAPVDAETTRKIVEILKLKDVQKLNELIKANGNAYLQSRALLRCGDVLQSEGKLEQAVKTYLQLPAFFSTESLLSLRASYSAAEALYQLQRADDAVKLLQDYVIDNPSTPYKELLEVKMKMFKTPKEPTAQQ